MHRLVKVIVVRVHLRQVKQRNVIVWRLLVSALEQFRGLKNQNENANTNKQLRRAKEQQKNHQRTRNVSF